MGEIFLSGAHADLTDHESLGQTFFRTEGCCNRRSGGRYHLAGNISDRKIQLFCRCDSRHSRGWNRDSAVLAPDVALALINRGNVSLRNAQIHGAGRRADDIHDGIHSAGLMEVNLLQRTGVNPGFCLADNAEDLLRQSADLRF